jgi:carboxylesterase type B
VHSLGATHNIDLFFVFGNYSLGYGLQPSELPLASTFMDAWGAFARTGDPSTRALPWAQYTLDGDEHMNLDLEAQPGTRLRRDICDFWDSIEAHPSGMPSR